MLRHLALALALLASTSVWALSNSQRSVLFGRPGWVFPNASADMNFATGQYYGLSPSALTTSRASTESEVCNGQLTTFAANAPAITPGCGLWVWESRTNSIRNNGASTNWVNTNNSGLTYSVVGSGTENGIPYVDLNISGTTTSTQFAEMLESTTQIAATYGQTYSSSAYVKIVGGSLTNVLSVEIDTLGRNSSGAGSELTSSSFIPNSNSLGTQRQNVSATLVSSASVYAVERFAVNFNSGVAINATFRIGAPQLELNLNLLASVASATVAAGGSGGTNGACVVTVSGGTGTAATLNATIASGALSAIGSVASAGSYSAASGLPTSPATVTGCGLSGATVNLTPTNNAANAFATGPILTSGSAATRAQPTIIAPASINISNGASLAVAATPNAPTINGAFGYLSDGTLSNFLGLLRTSAGATGIRYTVGGVSITSFAGPTISAGTLIKQGASAKNGLQLFSVNASTQSSNNGVGGFTSSQITFGARPDGSQPLNGLLSRLTAWKTAVSQAQLNAATH